jgi:hypothetical protein
MVIRMHIDFYQMSIVASETICSCLPTAFQFMLLVKIPLDHLYAGGFDHSLGFRSDLKSYSMYTRVPVLKLTFVCLVLYKVLREAVINKAN